MSNPPPPFIHVEIHLHEADRTVHGDYTVSPSETLSELFSRFAREYPLNGSQSEWVLLLHGQPLSWTNTVGEVSKSAGDPPVLVLALNRASDLRGQSEGAGGDWDKEAAAPPATSAPSDAAKPKPPTRGMGGGGGYGGGDGRGAFAVPAPGAAPAPVTRAPAPAPPPPEPAKAGESRRNREEADDAVFRDEMPAKKKRGWFSVVEFKKGVMGMEEETVVTRSRAPKFADDEDGAAVSRQATVRYYHRMNPQRVYPFLVVLSAEEIAEIVQSGVKQAAGERFDVAPDSPVEIEPVLPGCQVYPPRHTLVIGPETQTLEFWVVPQVLGAIKGAKVIVRQDGATLSEVKLEAKVVTQTVATVVGAMSFVMPYVTKGLKSDNPDNSTLQSALNWVATNLRPELIWAGLALVAVGLYFWCRPRKRDQFWDVNPKG